MTSFIYVVLVRDRWLVYSPLHRVSALVNQAAVRELRSHQGSGRLAELASQLHRDPERAPQPREGSVRPQFLGLIPTRACNLRCVYCGFGAVQASSERMAPGLAVKAVNWMGEHAQRLEQQTLEVHFFGGEPFAAGEVMDVAVHRTRAVAAQRGLLPVLEVATNGVYREDLARFIGDYFDSVVLSFDGPREIHDRRRPRGDGRGSFEAVARTAHLLSQSPTELCFRICVAQDNVERLAEIVAWFSEEFQPSTIDFETLQPTPESRQAGLEPPDPYAFAVQYFRARRTAAQKGVEPNYAAALTGTPRLSFCPVGHDALIASPDGRISACYLPEREWQERGLDLHLGWLSENLELDTQAVGRVRRLVAEKPRCERCFCRFSCAGGCHVHHSFPNCSKRYEDFCIQTRLITACSLLCELDQEPLAAEVMENRPAMEALALQASDRLEDWDGPIG